MNKDYGFDGIGGFLPLDSNYHTDIGKIDGRLVNSGRNALELILLSTPGLKKIYIPDYYCGEVKTGLMRLGLKTAEYPVNESLECGNLPPDLKEDEALIAVNYFGVKGKYVSELTEKYPGRVIVDNCQAWYSPVPPKGMGAFFSPRKFFGVPDGGVACAPALNDDNPLFAELWEKLPQGKSYKRCEALLKRIDCGPEAAYEMSKNERREVGEAPLEKMSRLTELMLGNIPFVDFRRRRMENFEYLQMRLGNHNPLADKFSREMNGPMAYPYISSDPHLREELIKRRIFVATYWPGLLAGASETAAKLAGDIVPLPVDQRYDRNDMEYIVKVIEECERESEPDAIEQK